MEDFNCDKMIDRAVYGDRMQATELSVKDDEVVCPKPCLFCYTHNIYFFFIKRVHTFKGVV